MTRISQIAVFMGCLMASPLVWAAESVDKVLQNAESAATANGSELNVSGMSAAGLQITVSATATIELEVSANGTTYVAKLCTLTSDASTASSVTASGVYQCNVAGMSTMRARITANTGTVTVFGKATSAVFSGGSTGVAGWPTSSSTKTITWANSLANAMRVGDGVTPICLYTDATLGPQVRPCTDANVSTIIPTNFNWSLYDVEASLPVETVDPDAASKNAMYQYGANYKPLLSIYPSLSPRGVAAVAEESLNTNFERRAWATVTDVDTDALDFHFPVTSKMVGVTTITVRLVGASKNAAPAGNIVFSCAAIAVRPGTDTYAAHSITGEQTVTLTPATQYRPVAATSAAITLNGTVADGGEIVGSCEVDATGTTSAQMTDFRLSADARIQLLVNSRSD